uniref:Uncharacterized protein n=1 Tax=Globisporangium ultimum (strain ATCC 200006 / CBS 805.95 / DAOM BR144) TaxID=431595 RepID=K3X7T2_GLOUD
GYRVRKTTWRRGRIVAYKEPIRHPERPENIKKTVDQMQTTIEQQSREISKLSEQVRALQTMVDRLLSEKSVQ